MAQSVMDRISVDVDGQRIKGMWAWTVLRLLLGWSFLWAFLDKFFGLGFATCRAEESSSIDFACSAAMVKGARRPTGS